MNMITRKEATVMLALVIALLALMYVMGLEDPAMPYCPTSGQRTTQCAGRR